MLEDNLDFKMLLNRASGPSVSYDAYMLVENFNHPEYWQRSANAGVAGVVRAGPANFTGYSFTSAGTLSELNVANGTIAGPFAANVIPMVDRGFVSRQSLTNLLLNAGSVANLVTQDVTVTAAVHTLSFIGTGTITLSGGSTAGPLVGTGANNRVTLTFTPTAGTLTLTVTGNVQYAGLMLGNIPTGAPIIPTTGVTATAGNTVLKTKLFADSSAIVDQDMLFLVRVLPLEAGVGSRYLMVLRTSANERIDILQNSSEGINAVITTGGVTVYTQNTAAGTALTEIVAVLRRLGGNWRVGKYQSGALAWGTEAAAAFPTGVVDITIGNSSVGNLSARGIIGDARIMPGTFSTDASVITAIASVL